MRLEVDLNFTLSSPIHTTGDRFSLSVDRATYINPAKDSPALPATSIKGWLRHQAEAALRAAGDRSICNSPSPEGMCKVKPCKICRYFGSPRLKSSLVFQDAVISEQYLDPSPRMGVGIDRRRGTAREEILFSTEIAWGQELSTRITGIFTSREESLTAAALLYLASQLGFALGGQRTRGLGWVKLKRFAALIDGEELSLEEINSKVKDLMRP